MTGAAFINNKKKSFKPQKVEGARSILRLLKNHRDCDTTYKEGGDFWVRLFEQLDVIGLSSTNTTPCGRFFQHMLVDFPKQSGLDAGSVARSVAGLDYRGKKAILSYLSQLFDTAYPKCRFTDIQCEALLNRIKVQVFLHNYNAKHLNELSDQDQYGVFMSCLSMAPDKEDVKQGRAYFYQATSIPVALQHYIENAQKKMCDYIDKIKDPEKLASLLSCMRGFNDDFESKEDLAFHLVQLIADAYGIPVPVIGVEEYKAQGLAACEAGEPNTLQSTIQYKFSALKTREDIIYATFHEAAGHAVENMLARRGHEKAWNALDAQVQADYPMLDPDSDLRKGALMLAFNDSANHENGYYFSASIDLEKYKFQLNEKFSKMVEMQSGKNCIDKLNRLDKAVDIFHLLKAETTQSLIHDLAHCRAFIRTLGEGELKDFVNESIEILRCLFNTVDLCENPAYRIQYMEILSELLIFCSDSSGYASRLFLSRIEDSLRENTYRHTRLCNYPIESLRQLLVELDKLDGSSAFFEECETFMLPPVRHPEAIPA